MPIQQVCVVYVTREGPEGLEVLLGRKLTGLGAGKVVAPGGKLEPGETAADAARRELAEEVGVGLEIAELNEVGVNRYRFPTKPSWDQESHVFKAVWLAGTAVGSAELEPFWELIARIPFNEMWADAVQWLPSVLAGESCDGDYSFGPDLTSLTREPPAQP